MAQSREKTRYHLEQARNLIDKPQKWARAWGNGDTDREGPRRSFYDAIYLVTETNTTHPTPEFRALGRALGKLSVDGLLAFERDHTHRDLMELFDDAIAKLTP